MFSNGSFSCCSCVNFRIVNISAAYERPGIMFSINCIIIKYCCLSVGTNESFLHYINSVHRRRWWWVLSTTMHFFCIFPNRVWSWKAMPFNPSSPCHFREWKYLTPNLLSRENAYYTQKKTKLLFYCGLVSYHRLHFTHLISPRKLVMFMIKGSLNLIIKLNMLFIPLKSTSIHIFIHC